MKRHLWVGIATAAAIVAFSGCTPDDPITTEPASTATSQPDSPNADSPNSAGPPNTAPPGDSPTMAPTSQPTSAAPTQQPPGGTDEPEPDAMEYYRVMRGQMGPLTVGMPVQTAVDQGYLLWDDSSDDCQFWSTQGPYAERGIIEVDEDSQTLSALGGSSDRYQTSEGVGPGDTLGTIRETYGDRLTYDYFRDGGEPMAAMLREGNQQIVFLLDISQDAVNGDAHQLDDDVIVIALYTSEHGGGDLVEGPHSGC